MEPNIRAADAAHSGITRAPFLPHPHATHFPLSPLRAPWPSSEGRGICLFPLLPLVRPGAGSLKKFFHYTAITNFKQADPADGL